jgi:hypothetical protein
MIFGARKIKRFQTKGSFDGAWKITASWEGPWVEAKEATGGGNHFNGKFYGTNYGITATFARDFGGKSLTNTNVIKNLKPDDCKTMWKKIWDKMIFGDSINDDKVASLIFDMVVHNQNRFIFPPPHIRTTKTEQGEKTIYVGYLVKLLAEKTGLSPELLFKSEKYNSYFGGKATKTTDGCYVLSAKAIEEINKFIEKDAKAFFDELNAMRKDVEKKSGWEADRRMNAFTYEKITPNTVSKKFYDNALTTRKLLFFTRKGCRPCLQLKPTCESLAMANGYIFEELDADAEINRGLVIQYKIAPTPEVVLIDGDTTVSFGAADLFENKLALYLATSTPVEPNAQAQSDGNWVLPLAAGALAWYHFKSKKRIGNPDDNQNLMIGGGLLLLLLLLSSDSTGAPTGGALTAQELDAILNQSLLNEGPWEAEDSHTRKDKGNYHRGKGQFLGTSWGITADFLEDWYGKTSFASDSIKNISKDDAKKIITETVMTRARIAAIQDKWIAGLFFDWMWQRPSTCLEYVCLKAFGFNDADYQLVRKGFWSKACIPDVLINHLNGENRKGTFEAIKSRRLDHLENTSAYASFREGVRDRINRYQYGI